MPGLPGEMPACYHPGFDIAFSPTLLVRKLRLASPSNQAAGKTSGTSLSTQAMGFGAGISGKPPVRLAWNPRLKDRNVRRQHTAGA